MRLHADLFFQRPVNWILWSKVSNAALIVIPEEAEELIPRLRNNHQTHTHLILYAAPVTRKMLQFDGLQFYAIPSLSVDWCVPAWLRIKLGTLAGRLYFQYDEYSLLYRYFGIDSEDNSRVGDGSRELEKKTFSEKPLAFLQEWLAVRRKGQDFTYTPKGYICQGKILTANHPFFAVTAARGDNLMDKDVAMGNDNLPMGGHDSGAGLIEIEEDEEEEKEEEGSDEEWGGIVTEVDE